MDEKHMRIPPREVWLVFDFTRLSIKEMKEVYKEIKNDSNNYGDLLELCRCYEEKKSKECEEIPAPQKEEKIKEIKIPIMKKAPRKKIPPRIESINEKVKSTIPAPRQWWAYPQKLN